MFTTHSRRSAERRYSCVHGMSSKAYIIMYLWFCLYLCNIHSSSQHQHTHTMMVAVIVSGDIVGMPVCECLFYAKPFLAGTKANILVNVFLLKRENVYVLKYILYMSVCVVQRDRY